MLLINRLVLTIFLLGAVLPSGSSNLTQPPDQVEIYRLVLLDAKEEHFKQWMFSGRPSILANSELQWRESGVRSGFRFSQGLNTSLLSKLIETAVVDSICIASDSWDECMPSPDRLLLAVTEIRELIEGRYVVQVLVRALYGGRGRIRGYFKLTHYELAIKDEKWQILKKRTIMIT